MADKRVGPVEIYYDSIPLEELPRLHEALMARKVKIEFDYDRVGWSKTGFVYRVRYLTQDQN